VLLGRNTHPASQPAASVATEPAQRPHRESRVQRKDVREGRPLGHFGVAEPEDLAAMMLINGGIFVA
jgi:hypothetical protein